MKGKVLFLISGIIIGVFSSWLIPHFHSTNNIQPIRSGGYKFINPLLECDQANFSTELQPFKSKVESSVQNSIKSGQATHVSVYFRDMNNGPWFGVNEREGFSPASLLKVPIMITLFKQAEGKPELLEQTVTADFSEDANITEFLKPGDPLIPGQVYTLDTLITRMVTQSDNNATNLINSNFDLSGLSDTYKNIGVDYTVHSPTEVVMSVKAYASFFRILFNASYLSPLMSEKAMEMLSVSNFSDGIRGGIPSEITVSHKFGERRFSDPGLTQLHDCGIVYYPDHPYLLCIMTRGNNFNTLVSIIRDVSSLIYKEVDIQYH